jgi:hypothetical protein
MTNDNDIAMLLEDAAFQPCCNPDELESASIEALMSVCRDLVHLTELIQTKEMELSILKSNRRILSTQRIPNMLQSLHLADVNKGKFSFDGNKLYLRVKNFCTVKKANRSDAIRWMALRGYPVTKVEFDDDALKRALSDLMAKDVSFDPSDIRSSSGEQLFDVYTEVSCVVTKEKVKYDKE